MTSQTTNIEEHLAGIHKSIHNSEGCSGDSDLIKDAVKRVNPDKSVKPYLYYFTSVCLKNAPNNLFIHLFSPIPDIRIPYLMESGGNLR